MALMKKAVWTYALLSLFSCRSRPESSATRAVETTSLKGRVAIFDVYDKDKRLTRQVPGLMVSPRAVLMSGMSPDETIVLADSKRKGEKYIPLPAAKGSVAFIGLEAEAPQSLGLLPTTVNAVPPLSAQRFATVDRGLFMPRIKNKVIMFNELGYLEANAQVFEDGRILMKVTTDPRGYSSGGLLNMIYDYFVPSLITKPRLLSREEGERMIRKGGSLIIAEKKYDKIVQSADGWSLYMKGSLDPQTLDIVGFLSEDPNYISRARQEFGLFANDFIRWDIVPTAVRTAFESVGVKMNLPPEFQREIYEYIGCYKPGAKTDEFGRRWK